MTITAPERSRVAAAIHSSDRRTWEASLGIYLIVKGFKPSSPILDTGSRS
jgi:hypothetical protein